MPATQLEKVPITCGRCGHQQLEPRSAVSTNCRVCGHYIKVQETLQPVRKRVERVPEQKKITCFECGAELSAAVSAESTMCKRCGRYIDLKDYHVSNTVTKNFKTKGAFVIEAKGYVWNTEAIVGDAVIKGRLLGRLVAERTLTVYSTAEIKGTFKAGRLVIPVDNHFRWPEPIQVGSAEIAGELAADLRADGVIILRSTARLFGDLKARDLVVESGAAVVGSARIGRFLGT